MRFASTFQNETLDDLVARVYDLGKEPSASIKRTARRGLTDANPYLQTIERVPAGTVVAAPPIEGAPFGEERARPIRWRFLSPPASSRSGGAHERRDRRRPRSRGDRRPRRHRLPALRGGQAARARRRTAQGGNCPASSRPPWREPTAPVAGGVPRAPSRRSRPISPTSCRPSARRSAHRRSSAAAAPRRSTWSLPRMWVTWFLTVGTSMHS